MPTSGHLHAPRKLRVSDDRSTFRSGVAELDDWLHRFALQNQRAKNAVTYVALLDERVVGYYALCAAGVSLAHAPTGFAKRRPSSIR